MDLAALIPIAGILSGVAIMWICYKVLELRVVGRKALEQAAEESSEKKRLEARLAVLERIVTDRGIQIAEVLGILGDQPRELPYPCLQLGQIHAQHPLRSAGVFTGWSHSRSNSSSARSKVTEQPAMSRLVM